MTPKRRSVFSLIFIVNCISKFNLILYLTLKTCLKGTVSAAIFKHNLESKGQSGAPR